MTTPHAWVGLLPPTFDPDNIERAVVPYLSSSEQPSGERRRDLAEALDHRAVRVADRAQLARRGRHVDAE